MESRYPAAHWRPTRPRPEPAEPLEPLEPLESLGPVGEGAPRVLVFHTMVGYLIGADTMYRRHGHTGVEADFGVGGPWDGATKDGVVWQWHDLDPRRAATSIGTSDGGDPLRPWSARQLEALIWLGAWWCRQTGQPARLVRSPSEPGLGYHSQFESWNPQDLRCPGRTRVAQLIDMVIPGVAAALARPTPPPAAAAPAGVDMPLSQDDLNKIAATVWGARFGDGPTTGIMLQRSVVDVDAIAKAVVAALPAGQAGNLTGADVEAAVKSVLSRGVLG